MLYPIKRRDMWWGGHCGEDDPTLYENIPVDLPDDSDEMIARGYLGDTAVIICNPRAYRDIVVLLQKATIY